MSRARTDAAEPAIPEDETSPERADGAENQDDIDRVERDWIRERPDINVSSIGDLSRLLGRPTTTLVEAVSASLARRAATP